MTDLEIAENVRKYERQTADGRPVRPENVTITTGGLQVIKFNDGTKKYYHSNGELYKPNLVVRFFGWLNRLGNI